MLFNRTLKSVVKKTDFYYPKLDDVINKIKEMHKKRLSKNKYFDNFKTKKLYYKYLSKLSKDEIEKNDFSMSQSISDDDKILKESLNIASDLYKYLKIYK